MSSRPIGTDTVALGWQHEPAYVNELNAVQVLVTDASGAPVDDLAPGDLSVTVTFGGRTSEPVPLDPTWDEDTGLGTKGEYVGAIIPTEPGDYTFHLTGTIHGQAVDETATSGDSTFDPVTESTAIQFPESPAVHQPARHPPRPSRSPHRCGRSCTRTCGIANDGALRRYRGHPGAYHVPGRARRRRGGRGLRRLPVPRCVSRGPRLATDVRARDGCGRHDRADGGGGHVRRGPGSGPVAPRRARRGRSERHGRPDHGGRR